MDRYYKRWEYYKNNEPIESQINRAQKIIGIIYFRLVFIWFFHEKMLYL